MPRIILLAGVALALSAGVALSADMVQIKTEAEFRKLIVGKKMTHEWGWLFLVPRRQSDQWNIQGHED